MRVQLLANKKTWDHGEPVVVWVVVVNDSYGDATLDRRLLVGPTPIVKGSRHQLPVSLEPPTAREADNFVFLQPFSLYGREREFGGLPSGQVTFHAYLLDEPMVGQPAIRAVDVKASHRAAEPLDLTVGD